MSLNLVKILNKYCDTMYFLKKSDVSISCDTINSLMSLLDIPKILDKYCDKMGEKNKTKSNHYADSYNIWHMCFCTFTIYIICFCI